MRSFVGGLGFSRINSLIVRAAEDHYSCLLAVLAQLSENKKYYTTFITELKPVDPGFNKNITLKTYLKTVTESSQKRDVVWKLSILGCGSDIG